MTPFFSVVIPTFNRANLISRAIESVLNQPFHDFELIVVDDGSTDATREILDRNFAGKLTYLVQENIGVCAARNKGAQAAKGKFLVFLDSDDWLSENCLDAYATSLNGTSTRLVLGFISYYDEALRFLKQESPKRKGEHYGQGLTGSFAIDRNFFEELGGYDVKLNFAENSDLFLRIREGTPVSQIGVTSNGGVCIFKESNSTRRNRYSEKKYLSVKYFLNKHKSFFDSSLKDFINFYGVLAFSALYTGKSKEAREALQKIIVRCPSSIKTYLQLALFYFPLLAKRYYGRG